MPNDPQLRLSFGRVARAPRRRRGAHSPPPMELPLKPSPVYDTYWRFAAERQAIFFRRFRREPPPWTGDAVLLRHKFTNAYRASDRVSQFLIRHVIYAGDQTPNEIFFRVLLFKLFNRIGTWLLLERELGTICHAEWSADRYDAVLTRAIRRGERLYSAAYIMPPARSYQRARKHSGHLLLLDRMMRDELPLRLADARSLQEAFELLRAYPMMGDFLAYQYVTDLNYSALLNFSEMSFVVPGPGARRGIEKCFRDLGGYAPEDVIRIVADRQEREFALRGIEFQDLWGRRLQLIDCQNLFCEVDKYARVAHPDITSSRGGRRIKQNFCATREPIQYWYPPKWGLNERIATEGGQ